MKWENLTSLEFDEAIEKSEGVCLLPLGCLERHGEHLVSGCDSYNVNHVANLAAEKEYAVVFPAGFWLGEVVPNHSNDPELLKKKQLRGYISINPHTLLTVLEELCDEIHRNGFNKILIINGHGGNNPMLNYFVRGMLYKKRDYMVATVFIDSGKTSREYYETILNDRERFDYVTEADLEVLKRFAETDFGGGHGDFREVAACYAQSEKYVRPEKFYQEGKSIHRMDHLTSKGINFGGSWAADFPKAYSGYSSTGCTQTIGRAFCEINASCIAEKIRIIKDDTECLKIARRED